jgi:Flp pilus assembly pilin Flp
MHFGGFDNTASAFCRFRAPQEKTMIKKFLTDESGLELSEYAVAAALVTLAVMGAFTAVGGNIHSVIQNLANAIKP